MPITPRTRAFDPRVEERIVEMRLSPPENLNRVPGPRALLYYLPRDPEVQALQVPLPHSTRTVWKILHKHGCILERPTPKKRPLEPREPLEEIQMDFKDVSTVPSSESQEGKHQHIVEVCNFLDAGTSALLSAQAREDFHAQTAMQAVIDFLRVYGRPPMMTFDRDPRWVGSSSGRDFLIERYVACYSVWASNPMCARLIGQTRMPTSSAIIGPMLRSASGSSVQALYKKCVR